MSSFLAWLAPMAPMLAVLCCLAMGALGFRRGVHRPVVVGLAISTLATLLLILLNVGGEQARLIQGYQWIAIGGLEVDLSLRLDRLSLFLLTVVTGVSFLVACYSVGYMKRDAGYARYFAVFSGFVFSMTMLVLADNFLMLYAFWEGVGLCSYLLIGYWYERPSAAAAAAKAFLVNRIADCGFLLGILLLWNAMGEVAPDAGALGRLDYDVVFANAHALSEQHPALLAAVGFLFLLGAIGKSAQFPLHVWLPDAMEGPTPVSALIHAATMVTAGVYLLARATPLLVYTPGVLMLAAVIGATTALLGAAIALFQHDLKRVLAYSTVSQLGYMFLAVGCVAASGLAGAAVVAAVFHLFTHAFFKALLFLSAGNVMHAMGDVIDMRRFGGLRRVLPKTNVAFLIGAIALAGIPPLAGFWSKDAILAVVGRAASESSWFFGLLLGVGLLTVLLTSIYTFLAYFRTFHGPEQFPSEAGDHPREAPAGMLVAIGALALGAIIAGVLGPTGWLEGYLAPVVGEAAHVGESTWLVFLSMGLAGAGVAIAWALSRGVALGQLFGGLGETVRIAGENRFYLDEIYWALLVVPLRGGAGALAWLDRTLVNGLVAAVAAVPRIFGLGFRQAQTGLVQLYALAMAMGLTLILLLTAK